jgi:hypothetical protein
LAPYIQSRRQGCQRNVTRLCRPSRGRIAYSGLRMTRAASRRSLAQIAEIASQVRKQSKAQDFSRARSIQLAVYRPSQHGTIDARIQAVSMNFFDAGNLCAENPSKKRSFLIFFFWDLDVIHCRKSPGRGYSWRGSSASRKASPTRLKPRTDRKIARPGQSDMAGAWVR